METYSLKDGPLSQVFLMLYLRIACLKLHTIPVERKHKRQQREHSDTAVSCASFVRPMQFLLLWYIVEDKASLKVFCKHPSM